MGTRAPYSASRAASSSLAAGTDELAAVEARDMEIALTKALGDLRGNRFPAQLLPLLRGFRASLVAADYFKCHVLALSHDELGVIFDGLADPLEPGIAVALSSTCIGLRTPLRAGLKVLKERRARAAALCRKVYETYDPCSCAWLRDAYELYRTDRGLTADDMATLGMILRTNGLPRVRELYLDGNYFGDAGMQALCEGLGRGAAPSLRTLRLSGNKFGPAGAEALAAALGRGAMPKLEVLYLSDNPIGNQGVAALAAPLRKLPALKKLILVNCNIGDEGMASLVANLGEDDFKALTHLALDTSAIGDEGVASLVANLGKDKLKALWGLYLDDNNITDAGCARLVTTINQGGLPALREMDLADNEASEAAEDAVYEALAARM